MPKVCKISNLPFFARFPHPTLFVVSTVFHYSLRQTGGTIYPCLHVLCEQGHSSQTLSDFGSMG